MDRKAQTEVMIAALGMVFGLMLAPIPNLASEFVLSGIVDQMDVHIARQDAAIDTVQTVSPVGRHSKNFNPTVQDMLDQIRSFDVDCKVDVRPGSNRTVEFKNKFREAPGSCEGVYGDYDEAATTSTGQTSQTVSEPDVADEMNRPAAISYMIKNPGELEREDSADPPNPYYPDQEASHYPVNSIVLDPEVEID